MDNNLSQTCVSEPVGTEKYYISNYIIALNSTRRNNRLSVCL